MRLHISTAWLFILVALTALYAGGRRAGGRLRLAAAGERLRRRLQELFGRGERDDPDPTYDPTDEARVLERLVKQLDRMEHRIGNLETILDRPEPDRMAER